MPMLTQESVNAIEQVIMSVDFYAINEHKSSNCSCYEDGEWCGERRCEIFQEGITENDGNCGIDFQINEGRVSIDIYIDNEHGDAELFLVSIEGVDGSNVGFEVLLNRTLHNYLPRLEEAPSSPIIRTWGVKSFLESL